MSPNLDFHDVVELARLGDEAASTELVRRFEPFLQRMVRIRMRRRGDFDRLRRDVGSLDVCQSVFRSFFQGLKENRYRLDQPGDLEKLLQGMIRFNLATKARRSSVKLRKVIEDLEQEGLQDRAPGPDEEIADQDLIEAIQRELSEEELAILTLRLDDTAWVVIGQKIGCTPAAARVRLKRALARVRETMVRRGNA
jgi:RNA polymerase sigma factor (sigma-70 family)